MHRCSTQYQPQRSTTTHTHAYAVTARATAPQSTLAVAASHRPNVCMGASDLTTVQSGHRCIVLAAALSVPAPVHTLPLCMYNCCCWCPLFILFCPVFSHHQLRASQSRLCCSRPSVLQIWPQQSLQKHHPRLQSAAALCTDTRKKTGKHTRGQRPAAYSIWRHAQAQPIRCTPQSVLRINLLPHMLQHAPMQPCTITTSPPAALHALRLPTAPHTTPCAT